MSSAATTVVNTLFGAPGISDAKMFHPGLVSVERTIDFSKSNTAASTEYAVIGLPKGFVALGTFVESGADKNGKYPAATAFTPYVRDANDGDSDVALGSSFTPNASAYKRQTSVISSAAVLDGGAIVSATFGAQTSGLIKIGVFGFVPDADGLGNVVTPAPRDATAATSPAKDNVAKLDPYYG